MKTNDLNQASHATASTPHMKANVGAIKGENEMISRLLKFIVACLVVGSVTAMAGQTENEKIAVAGAEKWLGIVDSGNYGESWKEAAEYFRNVVKQEQWEQAVQAVRKPLGKLVSRKVKSATFKTALPGAPDGQYVVIEFETSFENKKSAVEAVTPMMDKDGKWRVSGYFIK